MRALQQWSFAQVVLVSLAWAVFIVALAAGFFFWEYLQARAGMGETGSGGIGAVSTGCVVPLIILVVILGGPVVLITAWLVVRGRGL